jgi:hypothetical protein
MESRGTHGELWQIGQIGQTEDNMRTNAKMDTINVRTVGKSTR